MDAEYFAEIRAAKKALNGEIGFYKHEQKELNNRLPMDAQDSYSSGYSDAIDHVDQQIDGLNSALKLLAEVERLRDCKCVDKCKLVCMLDEYDKIVEERNTLKRALELACYELAEALGNSAYQPAVRTLAGGYYNDFIHQAQGQEGKK